MIMRKAAMLSAAASIAKPGRAAQYAQRIPKRAN